jgi:ankyrin repeat protein
LIEAGANVEQHNENGHTPLMESASAGHVGVARILLNAGAGINTHSNEFKESALTLACYKGNYNKKLKSHTLNSFFLADLSQRYHVSGMIFSPAIFL